MWKANVLPLLQQHVAEQVDSMTSYMLLQHEAAVANLLEVMPSKLLCCLMDQLLYALHHTSEKIIAITASFIDILKWAVAQLLGAKDVLPITS